MATALQTRVGAAAVLIPSVVLLAWLGRWPLALGIAGLGVLGTRELFALARKRDVSAFDPAGYAAAGLVPLAVYAARGATERWALAALYIGAFWLLGVLVVAVLQREPRARPLAAVAVTWFAPLYASATLAFLIAIRHGANSDRRPLAYVCLALFPLVLTWICDTAAYVAGSRFGGAKLAPTLSPKKTWAGAWAGLAGAMVFAAVLGALVLNRVGWHFSLGQLLVVGVMVGVVAQLGDVAESMIKREAGVKDSSALIPGHGGVLDRLDSLYFVVPVAAALFKWFGVI
jgi:phosphatidate cytidylyltransferase